MEDLWKAAAEGFVGAFRLAIGLLYSPRKALRKFFSAK